MQTKHLKVSKRTQILAAFLAMACLCDTNAQDGSTPKYPPGTEVGGIPVGVTGSGVYYIPDGGENVGYQGLAYNDQTGQTIPCSGETRAACIKMLNDATKPKTNTPPTNTTTTTTTDGTPPTTSGKPPSDGTTPGDGSTPPVGEDKPRKGKNKDKTDGQRRAR